METTTTSGYHGDSNPLLLPWRPALRPPSCYHGDHNPLCGGMLDERLMFWGTRDASVYPITVQTFNYHLIGQEG
ncbi:unnamed protein product [Boreogadus saida]